MGFLSQPELGSWLTEPDDEPADTRQITFDPPPGWRSKGSNGGLEVKRGRTIGVIMIVDSEFDLKLRQRQIELTAKLEHVREQGITVNTSSIAVKGVSGAKYVTSRPERRSFKQVEYLLMAQGGFVNVQLMTTDGADFDESEFEDRLYTLKVIA